MGVMPLAVQECLLAVTIFGGNSNEALSVFKTHMQIMTGSFLLEGMYGELKFNCNLVVFNVVWPQ